MEVIDYFRILKTFATFFHEKYLKSKWESSGRNASRYQFRCCKNNIKRSM